jgi:hypothetical protein
MNDFIALIKEINEKYERMVYVVYTTNRIRSEEVRARLVKELVGPFVINNKYCLQMGDQAILFKSSCERNLEAQDDWTLNILIDANNMPNAFVKEMLHHFTYVTLQQRHILKTLEKGSQEEREKLAHLMRFQGEYARERILEYLKEFKDR